jgi:hypothetical protein
VLHLLLAGLLKAGCPALLSVRLATAALPPALLASVFLVSRRLFGPSTALACMTASLLPFSFHLQSGMALAAALGLIELLWLMEAVERNRPRAAGLLLALLFYTHLWMPWAALAMVAAYAALNPAARGCVLRAGWGAVLALPWLVHLGRHRGALQHLPRWENVLIEIMPLLLLAAAAGLVECARRRGPWLWPLAALAGGVPLVFGRLSYRLLSGEGLVPVLLLAGVGMCWLARRLAPAVPVGRDRGELIGMGALTLLLVCAPTLAHRETGWRWLWPDAAPWHLLNAPFTPPKRLDAGIYSPQVEKAARLVERSSGAREIIWSNAPYAGGFVAALAHRPTSSFMFSEIRPARSFDPPAAAHLILWFKLDPRSLLGDWSLVSHLQLIPMQQDEFVALFRQPAVAETARPPQAACPLWAAWVVFAAAVGVIGWDLRGSRQGSAIPV